MIDKKFIGSETPVRTFEVERYPIRCFARAIGETNPIHSDEAAAQRAGFRSLVAPPTFAFCVNMMASDAALGQLFREMGVSFLNLLHGEQSFTYHQPIVAGDVLTLRSRIVDVYEKKGGALGFIVFETAVANERGERVVDLRNVSVVRN
ncbi:MAG TPA: MaoC family dehydratase N-terminal domain-containing protein [Steroidobacteraceae bacterium]|nr:MaoC family dehydratase N-terminal domain-containing protein [Steroidobacteraceae bacterium]